ncbi:MAG TPA: hypothetical protein VN289_03430 [Paraburkholderia sp.]|nr:hypothetical protein [Paraburkholderia sp.]
MSVGSPMDRFQIGIAVDVFDCAFLALRLREIEFLVDVAEPRQAVFARGLHAVLRDAAETGTSAPDDVSPPRAVHGHSSSHPADLPPDLAR